MNKDIRKIEISAEDYKGTKTRDCYEKVRAFIDKKRGKSGKILALFGLRRTGKSFLLSQIMAFYGNDKVDYYEFPSFTKDGKASTFTMDDVYDALDESLLNNKSIVLLDEITNVSDFIYDSEILADEYAKKGLSIIVAGTDSLGLILAGNEPLLGRKPDIPMTYISFAEHCRVLDTKDIDDYIRYGGLMHEGLEDDMVHDIVSERRYLDSAVSGNIVRSLKKYAAYSADTGKYEEIQHYETSDIEQIVNKFVEDYSGRFELGKINTDKIYHIIDLPLKRYRRSFSNSIKDQITSNREAISAEYAAKVNTACHLKKPATAELISELRELLYSLSVVSSNQVIVYSRLDNEWQKQGTYKDNHIIQPAIKYYQLEEAKKMYMNTPALDRLSEKDRVFLSSKLEEKIMGDMTENIVLFDTSRSLDPERYLVCKPEFKADGKDAGEYDMLVYEKETRHYYAFEVKHTKEAYIGFDGDRYNGQDKHLIDNELKKVIDSDFGDRKHIAVLYNGDPFEAPTGTTFLNIADFLLSIAQTHDIEKTCADLMRGLPIRGTDIIENFNESKMDFLLKTIEQSNNKRSDEIINSLDDYIME